MDIEMIFSELRPKKPSWVYSSYQRWAWNLSALFLRTTFRMWIKLLVKLETLCYLDGSFLAFHLFQDL